MQDYRSLNGKMCLPKRYCAQPKADMRAKQLLQYIAGPTKPETNAPSEETKAGTTAPDPHTLERSDAYVYADDTNLVTEQDTTPQVAQKLENYSDVTDSRNVGINWEKAEIIARKKSTNH